MRHQFATVHELARIEMLAGLPGEALATLAERMERRALAPGETISGEGGGFTVVISGMLRADGGAVVRPGDTLGGLTAFVEPVRAMLPSVVATCDRKTFDELLRPRLAPG